MNITLQDWLGFLRDAGGMLGVPLICMGLGLMVFGWRMWKVCVVLSFALIGAYLASRIAGDMDHRWIYALSGAVLLGCLGYWPSVRSSVAVLGGLIGGGVVFCFMVWFGLYGLPLWLSAAAGGFGCMALAILNRCQVVIAITAFLGAALLISGATSFAMSAPLFYGTLRSMVGENMIVLAFLLLVPTVMSCFYQIAEVRRAHVEV